MILSYSFGKQMVFLESFHTSLNNSLRKTDTLLDSFTKTFQNSTSIGTPVPSYSYKATTKMMKINIITTIPNIYHPKNSIDTVKEIISF